MAAQQGAVNLFRHNGGSLGGAGGTRYTTMAGEPIERVYESKFVGLIDILGFRDFIRQSESDTARQRDLHEVLTGISEGTLLKNYYDEQLSQNTNEQAAMSVKVLLENITITSLSDSIILSAPQTTLGAVVFMLTIAVLIQRLLERRILVRGGVTIGDIFHKGNVSFGPAFIRAYDLERLHARYPRIIFDPLAADAVISHAPDPLKLPDLFCKDTDGWSYFRFLYPLAERLGHVTDANKPKIAAAWKMYLSKVVEIGVTLDKDPVIEKYNWLANYMNHEFENSCVYDASMRLPTKELGMTA